MGNLIRWIQLGFIYAAVVLLSARAALAGEAAFDPNDPGKSGYKLVFDEEFGDASHIEPTGAAFSPPGFNFYTRLFPVWGSRSAAHAFSISNGVMTIAGGQLTTAGPAKTPEGYSGWAFAGGAYFEARIAFDPATVSMDPKAPISDKNWWPSFYAVAAEYFTDHDQWPGKQAGYVRFAEDDFFEAWAERYRYGATMHDWYGMKGCEGHAGGLGYCHIANYGNTDGSTPNNLAVRVPRSTDWREFHTIGNLWISGERAADHRGLSQFYFDGKPTTSYVTWVKGDDHAPPAGSDIFSVMDRDHMIVYIGSPAYTPLRVDWVHVWQLPGDGAYPEIAPQPGFTGGNGSHTASK